VILENIYSFAKNQTETIDKFLCLNGWSDRMDKSNHKNIHPLLYELQAG
jgi:hypothetical protein